MTAEDGRVYERNAIQSHIDASKSNGRTLKSPMTNQPIGTKLLANPQARNIIEAAIQNGDMREDLARGWEEKMRLKQELESSLRAARAGHGGDAVKVAETFQFGTEITKKDSVEAAKWWKVAAQAGECLGLLMHGRTILSTSPEDKYGVSCLTEAAASGCSLACLYVGEIYSNGPRDEFHAVRSAQFLQKGLDSAGESHPFVVTADGKAYYRKLLQNLANEFPQAAPFLASAHESTTDDNSNSTTIYEMRRQLAQNDPNGLDLVPLLRTPGRFTERSSNDRNAMAEEYSISDESETSSFLDIFDVVTRYPNDVSRTYPEEVIVEQAGNEIVNGIYKRDGYHEGAIKFSKTGRYNGEPAAFSLYKCRVSNNTKHWYISLVPPDCVPGTSYDTDFYCAPEATDRHDLPPLGGWAKSNEGVDPLPYVSFRNWSSF